MSNYEQENQEYVGAEKLADAATEILRTVEWFQADRVKGSVGAYPNARQIRFYEQQKLMEPPIERRRNAPVYRNKDLLALCAIKSLQAQRLPISVIKTLVAGKPVEVLEKLLGEEIHVFTDQKALDQYRKATGHTDDSDVKVINDPESQRDYLENEPERNEAKKYLESLLSKSKSSQEHTSQLLFSAMPPKDSEPKQTRVNRLEIQPSRLSPETWQRFIVAPGLELNIERKFSLPFDNAEQRRLIKLLEEILKICMTSEEE